METIRNIQISDFGADSIVLSTSGVAACIAAIVELETKVFMYHVDPSYFNTSTTCSMNDADAFLMKIFDKMCQLDQNAIIKNVC
jgi:hypothetical protein